MKKTTKAAATKVPAKAGTKAKPETKEEVPKPVVYKVPKDRLQTLRLIGVLRQQGSVPIVEQMRQLEAQYLRVNQGADGELAKLIRAFSPGADLAAGCRLGADDKAGTITVTPPSSSQEGPQDPA